MIIRLKDVGRSKWSGDISAPDAKEPGLIAALALREAREHLMSRDVDTVYDAEINKGEISAGWHVVGTFEVIESQPFPHKAGKE